jgi:hypothetical protein
MNSEGKELIRDLDWFVQWLSNEMTAKRIDRANGNKIVESISVVQNFIEGSGY